MDGWEQVEIAGKRADILDVDPGASQFGVIYLHTFNKESLAANEIFSRLMRELKLGCICPRGEHCWWADRICPEFDATLTPERYVVEQVLPFIAERWELEPRAVGLI